MLSRAFNFIFAAFAVSSIEKSGWLLYIGSASWVDWLILYLSGCLLVVVVREEWSRFLQ